MNPVDDCPPIPGNGPAYPPPPPLPPRSEWRMSLPIPATDPAASGHATRSPARRLQRPAAAPEITGEGCGDGPADHGPEIATEAAGPEWPPTSLEGTPRPRLVDPAPLEIPRGNPGADLEQLLRQRLTALAATDRPLGIHPPPRSPADPGPHLAEPHTPRWRWWRRTWTRWTTRAGRKPKE